MLGIIDLDSLVYQSAGGAKGEDVPVTHALSNAKRKIESILKETQVTDYVAYLTETSDPNCFRTQAYPLYKAHRKKYPKPKYYQDVRDYYIKHWGAKVVGGIEADDKVCMEQWQQWKELRFEQRSAGSIDAGQQSKEYPSVLIGIDKDLKQVPGAHYQYAYKTSNGKIKAGFWYWVTPLEACKYFYKQVLEGDPADNIPRIQRGWKKLDAFRLIDAAQTEDEVKEIVCNEIKKCGKIPEEELQWRGELLYLRRSEEDRWKV